MTLERRIGGYSGEFICRESQLLINILHPNKSHMLFSRFTNDIFPETIRQIADDIFELFQVIKEIPDDKIIVSQNDELILVMSIGKKSKEYVIPLEKAQMSNEQGLKKKVEELEKMLQQKSFEAAFYKDQYNLLLKNLQLKPNVPQLEKIYLRNDLSQLIFGEKDVKESKLTNNSSKVGNSLLKEDYKCPNQHVMTEMKGSRGSFVRNRCNICRQTIDPNANFYRCKDCDFDSCMKCLKIPPQHRKYCPNHHALTFGIASYYEMRLCDVCEKSLGKEKGYSCVQCDFDICKGCL